MTPEQKARGSIDALSVAVGWCVFNSVDVLTLHVAATRRVTPAKAFAGNL